MIGDSNNFTRYRCKNTIIRRLTFSPIIERLDIVYVYKCIVKKRRKKKKYVKPYAKNIVINNNFVIRNINEQKCL